MVDTIAPWHITGPYMNNLDGLESFTNDAFSELARVLGKLSRAYASNGDRDLANKTESFRSSISNLHKEWSSILPVNRDDV